MFCPASQCTGARCCKRACCVGRKRVVPVGTCCCSPVCPAGELSPSIPAPLTAGRPSPVPHMPQGIGRQLLDFVKEVGLQAG